MTYTVREIYFTLQGEGARTGRPAVFLRFAGCNLWSGREQDRAGAVCRFCDTEFIGTGGPGGGKFADAESLAAAVRACWPGAGHESTPYVVCTGGEPLLQLDGPAIEALHNEGFEIAVETNGTIKAPAGIDWLCVSPKGVADRTQISGDVRKLAANAEQGEWVGELNGMLKEYEYENLPEVLALSRMAGMDETVATVRVEYYDERYAIRERGRQSHPANVTSDMLNPHTKTDRSD